MFGQKNNTKVDYFKSLKGILGYAIEFNNIEDELDKFQFFELNNEIEVNFIKEQESEKGKKTDLSQSVINQSVMSRKSLKNLKLPQLPRPEVRISYSDDLANIGPQIVSVGPKPGQQRRHRLPRSAYHHQRL